MSYVIRPKELEQCPLEVMSCVEAMLAMKESQVQTGTKQLEERDYISSLKCKFCQSGQYSNSPLHTCSLQSVEVRKEIEISERIKNTAIALEIKDMKRYYPDMVFHESNNPLNIGSSEQHLICEVKTKEYIPKRDFYKDFFKLNLYVERLRFRVATYLLVLNRKEHVEKRFKEYVEKGYFISNNAERIYFLIQNKLGSEVKIYNCEQR